MKKNSPSDHTQSTALGWKFVAIVAVLTSIFFSFLYLAMSSEPDYMPSQQRETRTTAIKNAPVMSQQALAEAEQTKATTSTHDAMQMSDDDMQSMQNHSSNTEHSH